MDNYKEYVLREFKEVKDQGKLMQKHAEEMTVEMERWKEIAEIGCQDPIHEDGVNLNLCRNHIIFDKKCMMACAELWNIELPEEYYIPIPPEVNMKYMAKKNNQNKWQDMRIEKLCRGERDAPEYNEEQLSFL